MRDDNGDVTHVVGIITDITDRHKAETELRIAGAEHEKRIAERTAALERMNKDLEGFTYSVSHDLKGAFASNHGILQNAG